MEFPEIAALGIYDSNIVIPNTNMSKNRKVTMFEIELPIENSGFTFVDDENSAVNINTIPSAITVHETSPFDATYLKFVISATAPSGSQKLTTGASNARTVNTSDDTYIN